MLLTCLSRTAAFFSHSTSAPLLTRPPHFAGKESLGPRKLSLAGSFGWRSLSQSWWCPPFYSIALIPPGEGRCAKHKNHRLQPYPRAMSLPLRLLLRLSRPSPYNNHIPA